MKKEKIVNELFKLQDLKYRDFHSRLIPDIPKEKIIGVRTPDLKKFAKALTKEEDIYNWNSDFVLFNDYYFYEEKNLKALLISIIGKNSFEFTINETKKFLPVVDNWATCDLFCPAAFSKNPDKTYAEVLSFLKSTETFTVRFGIRTLISLFTGENYFLYKPEGFNTTGDLVASIKTDQYYINMAMAWYFAELLVKHFDETIYILKDKMLSKEVHNKTIQKAVESFRISQENKTVLRKLKIY